MELVEEHMEQEALVNARRHKGPFTIPSFAVWFQQYSFSSYRTALNRRADRSLVQRLKQRSAAEGSERCGEVRAEAIPSGERVDFAALESAVRSALSRFGTIVSIVDRRLLPIGRDEIAVRFASHDAVRKAVKAAPASDVWKALSALYNNRPYNERGW